MTLTNDIFYFGYGSNLWLDQMRKRCPESQYIGIGLMEGWKWIINTRGYANIIPSEGDVVYGFIFRLRPQDRASLDVYEGTEYERQFHVVKALPKGSEDVEALVYIDVVRKKIGPPKDEYVYRMNMAIADALEKGVPKDYIDKNLRQFIPLPN